MKITKDDWMKLATYRRRNPIGLFYYRLSRKRIAVNCWNRSIDHRCNLHVIRIRQEQECLR